MPKKQLTHREAHFAAKLLFQFRVVVLEESSKRRTCEVRIILLQANSPKEALKKAKHAGKMSEHDYMNSEGNQVYFEFVGVAALRHLGIECEQDEVWYDMVDLLTPMERKSDFIPPDHILCDIPGFPRKTKQT